MTINPHTGEYTHEDLTTLRTRFESLLDSGPVHITWHHITTKNTPTATATHLQRSHTPQQRHRHPHLTHHPTYRSHLHPPRKNRTPLHPKSNLHPQRQTQL